MDGPLPASQGVPLQLRRRLTVLVTGVLLTFGTGTAPASPAPAHSHSSGSAARGPITCPVSERAPADGAASPPMVPQRYYRGDWRLGPRNLPHRPPIGPMLYRYRRLDHTSAQNLLNCYWNYQTHNWWYPRQLGFVVDKAGNPVEGRVTLQPGQYVDLFGTGLGRFLAPAGTLYSYRALPPSNLDTLDPRHPFGYHLYVVRRPTDADAGPAAPWFGQPGGGLQYYLNATYYGGEGTIPWLVQNGYLRELRVPVGLWPGRLRH